MVDTVNPTLVFDKSNKYWTRRPKGNKLFLMCQQNYCNDMLRARGHIFLNEVYDMLGFARSRYGATHGWVLEWSDEGVQFFDPSSDDDLIMLQFNVHQDEILDALPGDAQWEH
jgi:hypothetical protein